MDDDDLPFTDEPDDGDEPDPWPDPYHWVREEDLIDALEGADGR